MSPGCQLREITGARIRSKRNLSNVALLLVLCFMSACAERNSAFFRSQESKIYISNGGKYAVSVPKGWLVEDRADPLRKLANRLERELGLSASSDTVTDAIFIAADSVGLIVLAATTPCGTVHAYSSPPSGAGSASSDSGMTTHEARNCCDGKEYVFNFYCPSNEFSKWKPIFDLCLQNIRCSEADISSLLDDFNQTRSGFRVGFPVGILRAIKWAFPPIRILKAAVRGDFWLIGLEYCNDYSYFSRNDKETRYSIGVWSGQLAFPLLAVILCYLLS